MIHTGRLKFRIAHVPALRRRRIHVAAISIGAIAIAASTFNSANAETWAERLGFPADHKVLLLHVQELGMCYETNAAGTALLDRGVVRSASAMAPCPWFPGAAKWSAEHADVDVGLALTINSEWPNYRWRPVADENSVATLLDPDRFLWRTPTQVMVNASADDVKRELLAQIAYARSRGLQPTHFTTHLGALVTRPDLFEVYLEVARRQWIPAMMVELTPEQVVRFEQSGFPLPESIIQLLANYPLPKVDDLRFLPVGESYEAKKQGLLDMLKELTPGITQIAISPAIESDALKQIDPGWQQRVWEAKLMADPDVQAALSGDDIVITDWREVMARFEGRPVAVNDPSTDANAAAVAPQ